MITLYIFRHAEVQYPLDSQGRRVMYPATTELSEEGVQQLTSFAQFLKSENISFPKMITSHYIRAVQSAEIIGSILDVPVIIKDERLRDSDVGEWLGKRLSLQQEVMDKGYDIYSPPAGYPQAAETREQVASRMKQVFDEAVQSAGDNESIALVSHGDPIRLLRFVLEHPNEQIPFMCQLEEGYVKRGEALKIVLENKKIVSMDIVSNLPTAIGEREVYTDFPTHQ